MKTTQERVLERYNSTRRRPTAENQRIRAVLAKSFDRQLKPYLPANREVDILDVACGEGALLDYLRNRGFTNLHGFDISPENVAICHRLGLPFVQPMDVLTLVDTPPDRRFNMIFAFDIVEHIPKEKAAAVVEALRLRLEPGGSLLIRLPNMGYLLAPFHRYGDLTHEFGVNENSLVDLLIAAGFEPDRLEVMPLWEGTTALGYLRNLYLSVLHRLVFLIDGAARPRIPTKNLLARATA